MAKQSNGPAAIGAAQDQSRPGVTDINEQGDPQAAGKLGLGHDIPVDDGEMDGRSQLSKLALSLMGVRPELSIAREEVIDGRKVKAGRDVLQAVIFGAITGLTGPKELPNAKTEADKYTYGLKGSIEGVNAISGEMYKAAILYLPAGFHDMFLAEMESALKAGDVNTQIAFALEFWSIPSDNPRGYSWKAVNKMPMEKRDPLARLRQRAMQGVTIKALAAPAS